MRASGRLDTALHALVPGPSLTPLVLAYTRNILAGVDLDVIGADGEEKLAAGSLVPVLARAAGEPASAEGARETLRRLVSRIGRPEPPGDAPGQLGQNLATVARALGFTAAEKEVLQLMVVVYADPRLDDLAGSFGRVGVTHAACLVAAALARPTDEVLGAIAPSSALVRSGVIRIPREVGPLTCKLNPLYGLVPLLLGPRLSRAGIVERFLPRQRAVELGVENFAHLAEPLDVARRLVAAALRRRRHGVNILLHGPAGTGKTTLAGVLAQECGATLHVVSGQDDDGDPRTPTARLSALLLGQRVLRGRRVILFDEMEDIFRDERVATSAGAEMGKEWLNRFLEENRLPVIWITNAPRRLDPAFRRRFAFSIEVAHGGASQRQRVLLRALATELSTAEAAGIAARFDSSTGELATAVAAARLAMPDRPLVESVTPFLRASSRLQGRLPGDADPVLERGYSLDFVNCDEDLAGLVEALASRPQAERGPSLCLYGPPGTGKSAFVAHLAQRFGRRLVRRTASSLLGMYVGQTEKAIARAFEEAREEDAVLLFDEADSFLRSREVAGHSWEVTMTNELLQQLEAHRGVVACTTNLWESIDAAALRRFDFKLELKPLRPEQARGLFGVAFAEILEGAAPAPDLDRVVGLTPGDFAAVARRERALGRRRGADELVRLLLREVEARVGKARRVAGF